MTAPPIPPSRRARGQNPGRDAPVDPARLTLGRKLRGLRKTELAIRIGVTPAAVSQYELGQSQPSPPIQAQIALALGLPVEFLRPGMPRPHIEATHAHFRSLRATSQLERDQALAFGQITCDVFTCLEVRLELPDPAIPDLPVPQELPPSQVAALAQQTRAALGLTQGPVPHVVRLLETRGTLVVRLPELSRRVDAFSNLYGTRPMIFLNPAKADRARARFDAAHELGHLVMHHDTEPGSRVVENQAHSFAAEFLMPADEIADELPRRVNWPMLHEAKRRWGTSLKALVYRARSLKLLTEHSYKRAMIQLNAWGDPEPGHLGPPEGPVMLGQAIQLLEQHGVPADQLAAEAGLSRDLFDQVVAASTPRRPSLQLKTR